MKKLLFIISFIWLILTSFFSEAQFYNGLHMSFGKNRVQYGDFYWQFYRSSRFDTYFYVGGEELAVEVSKVANKKLYELESFFDYKVERRLIFIVYNKLSDFRQSNIGLVTGDNQYNIGGVTKIVGNKVFIYNEGGREELEKQIAASIAEVLLNELLFGNSFRQKLTNSTLMNIPEWYTKGLISYLADNWNIEIDSYVKDGILSGKYEKFNRLTGKDAVYAGHSIWNYIAKTYGKKVIPNIIYLTRISKSTDSGFLYVLGTPIKNMTFDWRHYYDEIYYNENKQFNAPSGDEIVKRMKKRRVYDQVSISPDGNKAAWTTNELGKIIIWLYDFQTDKTKKIFKQGNKLDQITDYSYPVLAWHPTGELLAYTTEEKGSLYLNTYMLEDKKTHRKELFHFQKILDFSYSPNGLKMAVSAIQDGKTDLFVYSVTSNTVERITNDFADDFTPRFSEDGKRIVFSSNRGTNAVDLKDDNKSFEYSNFDVYVYDYQDKSKKLTRITETPQFKEIAPVEVDERKYLFLSDKNGIINRYLAEYDSTLDFIDTAAHYRYFTTFHPVTNYARNILDEDVRSDYSQVAEKFRYDGSDHLVVKDLDLSSVKSKELLKTSYRKSLPDFVIVPEEDVKDQKKPVKETIEEKPKDSIIPVPSDTSIVDINNYVFEKEKKAKYFAESVAFRERVLKEDDATFEKLKQRVYFTTFYIDYVVNQIDFGFINTSYQTFTGTAGYYNPNFTLFFKLGTKELFENYKITGGFRLAGNFNSNEYLLSFENLKGRIDKQFLFHRQTYSNVYGQSVIVKTHMHEMLYIAKYPFSQVACIKSTTSIRDDRIIFPSTNSETLKEGNYDYLWAGQKLEFIFDNTRSPAINIYYGTRFKLFGEFYYQLLDKYEKEMELFVPESDMFILGFDFRHYQKIHRELIWATRFAGSTSLGNRKLLYYLGGVDNWINVTKKPTFLDNIYEVPINWEQPWAFQALATNMRGFSQNIRNGNSFLVMNNEIRWPIVRYIANRPINSDFLSNLQVVGFMDVGSAWTGTSPSDEKNAYNTRIVQNGPIKVVIDNDRSPFVYGYGFGLRSRLLGYFIRADWAWGVDGGMVQPRMFYLSLSLDF